MKHIYRLSIATFSFLLFFNLSANSKSYAGIGDTTVVQTLRFDTNMRGGVFMFPTDTSKTYEKIIMLYSMRCKNGLISTSIDRNKGCGEWDYNCYTYMVDSSQTDSLRSIIGSYVISNFSDSVFSYTALPVSTYIQYNQQAVTYTSVISETTAAVGAGIFSLNNPLNTSKKVSRAHYLWTATELATSGLTAGNITGLKLDLVSLGSSLNNLRIKIKPTTQNALADNSPELTGFTEVYFLNTVLSSTGLQSFNFNTPFNWNGTSNLLVEFSYTNAAPAINNDVNGTDAGFNAGLVSNNDDAYLNANGSLSQIKLNAAAFPSITDKITIAVWAYGDVAKLPANTSIMEGVDASNNRQINIHFPWSDSNIYFDCGNDGAGYDRINKLATAPEIEGKWNFWAFTKNATTGVMNIYLNGALWATGSGKTKLIDLKKMVAGMGIDNNYMYYGGYDELSIWNKDLSLASIQQLMYKDISNLHPDYTNLLSYYKLNEGAGNTAFDSSPNSYNSEIINPGWRHHRGNTLFRNFTLSTYRPNITFVKGVYTTSITNYLVRDSIINNPTSVISYSVSNNQLNVIDTNYVWPSGYSYVYDTAGVKIDSIAIASQTTITILPLNYYQKRAMRLELINFITPYGINLDLDGLNGKTWEFDVTDYAPLLKGARYLAMEDGKYQEDNDIKFVFYEGIPPRDVKSISQIWPSGSWVSPSYSEINSNTYFEPRDIFLPANTSQYKIRSAISGHGQQGEFITRNHTLRLNNAINFTRAVWTECATNPIYPQGGTWVYDRAGWCPGAAVQLKEYDLTPYVTPGNFINLDYSLPALANPGSSNYRVNNQLVTYGAANFTLDAAMDYIKSPSNRTEFTRINPVCNEPLLAIRNTGSTPITSLTITYGRVGGTMSVYQWAGTLDFLESAEITLPAPNFLGSLVNQFIAIVSNPNNSADQYGANDTMYSEFPVPVAYPAGLIFELKTNNLGGGTTYTLKDAQGNLVINRNGLSNNVIYKDTVLLNTDCYTLHLNDVGDDGLSWWANTGQGTGYFRIRNATNNAIIKTFDPDFGDNIHQQFTVNYVLPVIEPSVEFINELKVYPNPAMDAFTALFSLPLNVIAKVKLLNVLGEELLSETILVTQSVEKLKLDASTIANGLYYVVLEVGDQNKIQKLVISR